MGAEALGALGRGESWCLVEGVVQGVKAWSGRGAVGGGVPPTAGGFGQGLLTFLQRLAKKMAG